MSRTVGRAPGIYVPALRGRSRGHFNFWGGEKTWVSGQTRGIRAVTTSATPPLSKGSDHSEGFSITFIVTQPSLGSSRPFYFMDKRKAHTHLRYLYRIGYLRYEEYYRRCKALGITPEPQHLL